MCLADSPGPLGVLASERLSSDGWYTGGITAHSLISVYDANMRLKHYTDAAKRLARDVATVLEAGKYGGVLEARDAAYQRRNAIIGYDAEQVDPR